MLRFILTEGRNRQIRRMAELVQLHVVDLFRIRIGHVHIGELPEGKWRTMTTHERDGLIDKSKADKSLKPDPISSTFVPPEKPEKPVRRQGTSAKKLDPYRNADGYSKRNYKAKSRPKYPGTK